MRYKGFSLVESATALIILALVSSSVLVVVNRSMASAADSQLRMQAFGVARENMEKLLAKDVVHEMAEYGSDDRYPEIQWSTAVEMFYEPLTMRMWIQAVCSAEYIDTAGETQTIELTHWLTDLTVEQLLKIMEQQAGDFADDELIETLAEAAEYAGVDEATIEQWEEDEMRINEDGYYVKSELDLYKSTGGKPSIEDRSRHAQRLAEKKKERARSRSERSDRDQQGGQVQPDMGQSENGESNQDKSGQSESVQEQPSQSESYQPESDGEKTISGRTFDEWVADGFPRELLEMLFKRY